MHCELLWIKVSDTYSTQLSNWDSAAVLWSFSHGGKVLSEGHQLKKTPWTPLSAGLWQECIEMMVMMMMEGDGKRE